MNNVDNLNILGFFFSFSETYYKRYHINGFIQFIIFRLAYIHDDELKTRVFQNRRLIVISISKKEYYNYLNNFRLSKKEINIFYTTYACHYCYVHGS